MAERDSLWVTGALDVEEARVGLGALVTPGTSSAVKSKTGIRPGANAPGAVTASGTPDGFVHVAAFSAFLQSGRGTVAGTYVMTLDAVKDINILSTPAHASLARDDLIIAHQSDTFYGDGTSVMSVRQVVGTPSATPSDPSTAAFPDSITLARVRVDANATTITSGKITDLRPSDTVALGGVLPVPSQTARNALTGLYDGYTIWRSDRDWVEIHDGTAFRVQGVPIVSSVGDLAAITNPLAGQIAWNTADDSFYRYSGSWRRADWSRPWGIVGGKAYTSSGGTALMSTSAGSEALANMDTGSTTLVSGRRYRAVLHTRFQFSATGANCILKLRETNVSGAERATWTSPSTVSSTLYRHEVVGEWDETASGAKTLVATGQIFGSGTLTINRSDTDNNKTYCYVQDVGPSILTSA